MSDKNLFEIAARKRYRYPSSVGLITTEDLYNLPLAKNPNTREVKANLNDVARAISAQLRALGEDSFVEESTPGKEDLENKLELVKQVIAFKQDALKQAAERHQRRQQRETIKEALAAAEARDMGSKSAEELKQMLKDLED